MKVKFPKNSLENIIESIKKAMSGRSIADIVSFSVQNNDIVVTISKLGTSTLTFKKTEQPDGAVELELAQEKIAFTHRAFKDEVKDKLVDILGKAGGTVA